MFYLFNSLGVNDVCTCDCVNEVKWGESAVVLTVLIKSVSGGQLWDCVITDDGVCMRGREKTIYRCRSERIVGK